MVTALDFESPLPSLGDGVFLGLDYVRRGQYINGEDNSPITGLSNGRIRGHALSAPHTAPTLLVASILDLALSPIRVYPSLV
jgi:hypothetical protein